MLMRYVQTALRCGTRCRSCLSHHTIGIVCHGALLLLLAGAGSNVQGQAPQAPAGTAGDTEPLLRLEAGGATSYVTALAFSPDGQTLYAAGFDKVVRAWRWNGQSKQFVLDPVAFRVPVGPGRTGFLNVLAVSPDGSWMAASGLGVFRVGSRSREPGRIYPYLPPKNSEMLREQATIYVFDTRTQAVRVLQGHAGEVLALAFAPSAAGKPPLLVSAAREPGADAGTYVGRVCLWDVSKAAYLDDKGQLIDPGALLKDWTLAKEPKNQVGLSVRHTGNQPKQVRVAIAWGDGKLRTWEPERDGPASVQEVNDGMGDPDNAWNNTVAYLPGSKLLTGSRSDDRRAIAGQLRLWDDVTGRRPEAGAQLVLTPPAGTEFLLVRALSLFSSKADGKPDHAAAIVRTRDRTTKEQACWLMLIGLADLKPVATTFLWKWNSRAPVIAAALQGQYLAVAGREDHAIQVYSLEKLLKNDAQPQRLRSVGITMRAVAFVHKNKGQDLGLSLSETARPVPGRPARLADDDVVFDFGQRSLTPNPDKQGWEVVDAALNGWRVKGVQREAAGKKTWGVLDWEGPGVGGQVKVELTAQEQVTDYALVPASRFSPVPLLALASWRENLSEARLCLYNARTGEQVRQFSGHTEPISCLAASPDGKLLASAAADQTVCLWTVTDLNQILGQQGTLWGVFVQKEGKSLLVKRVDEGSQSFGKLQVGDRIEGLSVKEGAKPRTFTSPLEYYNALWDVKPKTKVWLQIDRNGAKQAVEVVVGQGVDEQKPLLSLFITGGKGRARQWIAWTPTGPYDASSKDVERYLGWHFNPTRLEAPAKFAGADAYRNRFFKPKLLKALVAYGDYHKAIEDIDKPPPVPKPDMNVEVDAQGSRPVLPDAEGHILVRSPDVHVKLAVAGPSLEQHQVQSISWRLVNAKGEPHEIALAKAVGQTVSETVQLPPQRGIYRLEVRLRTREANPQETTRLVSLRYQPPPPEIRFDEAWLKSHVDGKPEVPKIVREATFDFQAQLAPRGEGQAIQAVLLHQKKAFPLPAEARIKQNLELQPGENVITLRAVNKEALPGYENLETEERTFVVVFNKKEAPQLLIKRLEPVTPRAESVAVDFGRPMVVGVSKVRILGEVKAAEKPDPVVIRDGKGDVLATADIRQGEFAHVLNLRPGIQELQFSTKTRSSEPANVRLQLQYLPPLPALEVTEPLEDGCLYEGESGPVVDLKGTLTLPPDPRPFKLEIRVFNQDRAVPQENGTSEVILSFDEKELTKPAAAEGQARTLARLRVLPGHNCIRIKVTNDWNAGTCVERYLSYCRPPRIVSMANTDPGNKPFTDVVAHVESPSALPLTHIESNGRSYQAKDVQKLLREEKEITTWEVRLPRVPLQKGKNKIHLSVSNADGRCRKDREVVINFQPEPEKPATVRIRKPKNGVRDPLCPLPVRVLSESPLERVELRKGTDVVETFDVSKQAKNPQGQFDLDLTPTVSLEDGTNSFKFVAVNAGGEASDEVAVSYVRVPVRLTFDNLRATVQERPTLELIGHIRFQDPGDAAQIKDKIRRMRFYVNDFQQRPAVLLPRVNKETEVSFSATVLLNRDKNKIEIECPDLPPEAGSQQVFTVDCQKPQQPARLHLLVVGVDVHTKKDKDRLVEQAFKALQADYGTQGLRSAVFNRVIMHPYFPGRKEQPLLIGHIYTGMVRNALRSVQRFIETEGSPNDVVLVYWLGRDAVEVNGVWYLPTSDSPPRDRGVALDTMIPLAELLGGQENAQGARVLLLDVATPFTPPVSLTSARAAVLRHAWSKQDRALPGLLMALETAAISGNRAVSLLDLQDAADRFRKDYVESLELTSNLELIPLSALVLTHQVRSSR